MVTKLVPPDSGGWIIRTVADDLTPASCKREIDHLLGLWKKIKRKASSGHAPQLVQRETSLTRGIVRDLLSDKVDLLLVDTKLLYNEVEQYLKQIDPELLPRVKLYQDETPMFDEYDIEAEIRNLFKQRVELPTGGYLIIQPTEALISMPPPSVDAEREVMDTVFRSLDLMALLVHDAGASRTQLEPVADRLSKQGFGVLTLDLRGHGGSKTAKLDWEKLSEADKKSAWAFAPTTWR